MHLLYMDDSGSVVDANCQHCVLAGFSVYETGTHALEDAVNRIMVNHLPASPDLEIHGTDIRTGRKAWRSVNPSVRTNIMNDVLYLINSAYPSKIVLFGAVVSKKAALRLGIDIQESMFTQIASRFDMYLARKHRKRQEPTRGIAIFDKCSTELDIQKWTHIFRNTGNYWGNSLRNFAEVPLFLDSQMSRLIQIADIIAYSMFRHYEYKDTQYFQIIQNCFDKYANMEHGLHELL